MHYQARYYSNSLGRSVSAGRLVPSPGNPQDLNLYSYTLSDIPTRRGITVLKRCPIHERRGKNHELQGAIANVSIVGA